MKKHRTIKTIAAKAGVSVATVSRVLNNKNPEKVGQEVRERVQKLIAKYKFTPNATAKSLISGKSNFIGLQILSTSLAMELMKGIEKKASEAGYNIILGISDWNKEKEGQSVNAMLEKGVDGILWIPSVSSQLKKTKAFEKIRNCRCPLICLNKDIDITIPSVCGDNVFGGYMAASHVWEHGFHNIVFIGTLKDVHSKKRFEGYEKLMLEKNMEPRFLESVHEESISTDTALNFLSKDKNVNAFVCASDYIALGAYNALLRKKINIGRDFAVTGYDNQIFSGYLQPPLTTVSPLDAQIGETAISLLLELINNGKITGKTLIKPELIIRNSCF